MDPKPGMQPIESGNRHSYSSIFVYLTLDESTFCESILLKINHFRRIEILFPETFLTFDAGKTNLGSKFHPPPSPPPSPPPLPPSS